MADNLADTAVNTASKYQAIVAQYATDVGMKILGAIVFWVVGRWLINLAVRMVEGSLSRQKVDPTVLRYVGSIITVTLNVLLVIGILGYFGIQTTTFAALIAAAGVAIGMAWSGLLSNFAAGDFVTAGGVTGTIKEIGLFATTINTPDNVVSIVGNGKIFADTIQNYTSNPFRRVELKAQLAGSADHRAAIALLKEKVAAIPNVLTEPAVDVEILEFNLVGPVLAVRPYTHNDNYWQVYFDTNRTIKEALAEAGFPAPTPSQALTITTPGQLAGLAAVAQSTTTPTSVN
jgi:small conductance mechanosensitive channel